MKKILFKYNKAVRTFKILINYFVNWPFYFCSARRLTAANETMQKYIKSTCLWIKEYKHPLLVIGGIMFTLALISGIFWIAGNDIEPLAFVLGMLSSLFFASPSIADYFLPNRKPVRHMSLEEIIEFIPTTDPINDWEGISREWSSEMFLKEDPRLRFKSKSINDGIQNDDFKDEWANCYPNSHAVGYWYELYYDGAFLDRIVLVSVDGGNAMLPTPNFEIQKVKKYNYHVAKIHDLLKSLNDYMRMSNLEIEDS